MNKLRRTIRKLILEACAPGNKFDTSTGMPCTANPAHWNQYRQNIIKSQEKANQKLMQQMQQMIDATQDKIDGYADELEQSTYNQSEWDEVWDKYEVLRDKFRDMEEKFIDLANKNRQEFFQIITPLTPYGKIQTLDSANRYIEACKGKPFESDPVTRGMMYNAAGIGIIRRRQKLFFDELSDIGRWYGEKFSKAQKGDDPQELLRIAYAKEKDFLQFKKDYLAHDKKYLEAFKGYAKKAKDEGKGWYIKDHPEGENE